MNIYEVHIDAENSDLVYADMMERQIGGGLKFFKNGKKFLEYDYLDYYKVDYCGKVKRQPNKGVNADQNPPRRTLVTRH